MNKQAFTKHRVLITPNNQPSGNIFSATSFPTIQFVLGSTQGMLDPRTLRLNYTLNVFQSDGTTRPVNDPTVAASATNGINFNSGTGSLATCDQINVSSMNGRNIETIQHYNRYVSTFTPNAENQFDLINTLTTGDCLVSSKNITTCRQMNVPTTHSVPLRTGFLSGSTPINLSQKGFHGLNLNIQLAQNQQALGCITTQRFSAFGAPEISLIQTTNTSYQYQLSNVFLTYDIYVPSDSVFASMPSSGTLVFNSINTLTSTLLANDSTTTLRLGLKNCLSVTHSFIPAIHMHNIKMDSMLLSRLSTGATGTTLGTNAPLNTVQYFKGGTLFPYNYILDSEEQAQDPTTVQAQILEPALHSVTLYDDSHHGMNPASTQYFGNIPASSASEKNEKYGASLAEHPDGTNFILGFPCDSQRVGVDYSRSDYAFRIQSGLNGATPFQFFTFARARNVAMYSPTGIEILE